MGPCPLPEKSPPTFPWVVNCVRNLYPAPLANLEIFFMFCWNSLSSQQVIPPRGGGGDTGSIAFGSAPPREVDNQPIRPLPRPAVSQKETHGLDFLLVADAAPSSGETFHLRTSSGRMVMQLTGVFLVGGSNSRRVNMPPPPPPPTVGRPGFEPPIEKVYIGCITIRPAIV